MIESNNKKIICVSFHTADEKLCKYENVSGEKSKNRDKLIQSATPEQQTKTETVPAISGYLEGMKYTHQMHPLIDK